MSKLIESDKMQIIDLVAYGYSRIEAGKFYGVSGQYVGKLIMAYVEEYDVPESKQRRLTNRLGTGRKRDFIASIDHLPENVVKARLKDWEHGYQTGYNQGRSKHV